MLEYAPAAFPTKPSARPAENLELAFLQLNRRRDRLSAPAEADFARLSGLLDRSLAEYRNERRDGEDALSFEATMFTPEASYAEQPDAQFAKEAQPIPSDRSRRQDGRHDATFQQLRICVMTISDTRTDETDTSGHLLADRVKEAGHELADKAIVPDEVNAIRAVMRKWIADPATSTPSITTGGTGLTGRDVTPEAVAPIVRQGDRWLQRYLAHGAASSPSAPPRCNRAPAPASPTPPSSSACRAPTAP